MQTQPDGDGRSVPERLPLGQRLYDNWVLLMIAGILVMVVLYTGWGFYEILTLPEMARP